MSGPCQTPHLRPSKWRTGALLQPGTTLQRGYVIEKVLGRGGMGAVYLARQANLGGRRVAIKETMLQGLRDDDREAARSLFQKEAEILASLEHPGLVDVKDYFEEGDSQYLVMAFIDGASLEQLCPERSEPPPVGQVIDWLLATSEVLTYLHKHEPPVIVRDLKPANIMLDARSRLRLIDFGIARIFDQKTETVTFLKGAGTFGYAPLEQQGGGTTDPRSDIYALGATGYRLLTATLPPSSVALASGEAALTPPSILNPNVSPALEAVILKMMGLRKTDRYGSADEATEALRQAKGSVASSDPVRVAVVPRFCHHCGGTLIPGKTVCGSCNQSLDPSLLGPSSGGFAPAQSQTQGPSSGGGAVPPLQPQGPPSGGGAVPQWQAPGPPSGGGAVPQLQPQGPPSGGGAVPQWQAPAPPSGGAVPQWQAQVPPRGAHPPGGAAGTARTGGETSLNPTQIAALMGIFLLLIFAGWYYYSHQSSEQPTASPTSSNVGDAIRSPMATPTTETTRTTPSPPSPTSPTTSKTSTEESGIDGEWAGTLKGNDPNVTAEFSFVQKGNQVTGTFYWDSMQSGSCTRHFAGTYNEDTQEYVLHDTDITDVQVNGRVCKIDEYVLKQSGDTLSGSYESESCNDTGRIELKRAE